MPAPLKHDRPTLLHLALPLSLRAQLDIHLYSELEGRVPKGAYQAFISERIREFFSEERVELAPGLWVRGSKEALEQMKKEIAE